MPDLPDPSPATSVSTLEQVGALASRLVHDLANHLCIISGNATFAELILDDRERVAAAIRAIVQASELAGRLLGRCGELREKLTEGMAPGAVAEIATVLSRRYGSDTAWRLNLAPGLSGRVPLPTRWVALAVQQILVETNADHGEIHVERFVRPWIEAPSTAPPGHEFLLIRIHYDADAPIPLKEIRETYGNFSFLAAYELIRNCGGRTEFTTSATPRHQEALVYLPLKGDSAPS
jgi:hypothetical protein